jgi:signal transduction histidine kinase/CheY-like chemotaxis protein
VTQLDSIRYSLVIRGALAIALVMLGIIAINELTGNFIAQHIFKSILVFTLFVISILFSVNFSKNSQHKDILNLLLAAMILGMSAFIVAKNQYMPIALEPLILFMFMTLIHDRLRLIATLVFIIVIFAAEQISTIQEAHAFVYRLEMSSLVIALPLHTCLTNDINDPSVRIRAAFQLFIGWAASLFVALILIGLFGVAKATWPNLLFTTSLIIACLWVYRLRKLSAPKLHASHHPRLIGLAITIAYYFLASFAGAQASMFLPVLIVVLFLLTTPIEAVMLSLVGIFGALYLGLNFTTNEHDHAAFTARFIMSNFGLLSVLYYWHTHQNSSTSLPTLKQFLILVLIIILVAAIEFDGNPITFYKSYWTKDIALVLYTTFQWLAVSWLISLLIKIHSNLKTTNDALELSEKKIQSQLDKQKELFSVIGHELRTPAASLNLLLNNYPLDELTEKQRRKEIELSNHLISILDDIKYIAKSNELIKKELQNGDPNLICKEVINNLRILYPNAPFIELQPMSTNTIDKSFQVQIVKQIVTNLLKNAIIHSKASKISIRLGLNIDAQSEYQCTIAIEDDGIGIPQKIISRLFKAFERNTSEQNGTGLGLYICKEYSKVINGNLEFEASPTGGALFTLTFPMHTASADKSNQKNEYTIKDKNILLVEDNPTTLIASEFILQKAGAKVTTANDGEKSLECYLKTPEKFDVILTDIMMPEFNGYDLARSLRAINCEIPIIGLTAALLTDECEEMIKSGADDCLDKPLQINQLLDVLSRVELSD